MFNGQTLVLLVGVACLASAPVVESFFVPNNRILSSRVVTTTTTLLKAEEAASGSVAATASGSTKKTKQLGLLTFDLDDTLYPIQPIVEDANST